MKSRLWLILVAVAWLVAGCRSPRGMDKMEQELRHQEDRIYQLEDWCRQYHDLLDSCRNENRSLREKNGSDGRSSSGPPVHVSPFEDSGGRGPKLPEVEIPKVEIPGMETHPPKSDGTRPPLPMSRRTTPKVPADDGTSSGRLRAAIDATAATERRNSHAAEATSHEGQASSDADEPSETRLVSFETGKTVNDQVASITLNRLLTTGLSRGKRRGDDGVMVLVEPRNSAGELIPPVGQLSISVIDPAATSAADARVARWDLTAPQTARAYHHSPLGDGISLNLTWPGRPPVNSRLMLHARLTTPDGRELMAERSLVVNLPIGPPSGTPTTPRGALVPEPETRQPNLFEVVPLAPAAAPVTSPTLAPSAPSGIAPPLSIEATRPPGNSTIPTVPPLPPAEAPVAIPSDAGATPASTSAPAVRTSDLRTEWTPFR